MARSDFPTSPRRSLALAPRFRQIRRRRDLPCSSATLAMRAPALRPRRNRWSRPPGFESLRFAPPMLPSELADSSASVTSFFRGPIPRPACSLSTLRSRRHRRPRKTRSWLAALPWPGGSSTRWVALSGFKWLLVLGAYIRFPPDRSFMAHSKIKRCDSIGFCRIGLCRRTI